MDRDLYNADHEAFRSTVKQFIAREVEPNRERWDEERIIGRDTWLEAGRQGLLGITGPEEHGGAGQLRDYRFRNVVHEELALAGAGAIGSSLGNQDDILIPYIDSLGNDEQRERWLPGLCSGEIIGAIAMTEPGTGSDLRGIQTTARKSANGWVLNGSKTFITSGYQADLVIVVARTGSGNGSDAFSLFVVEGGFAGFSRGRKLDKIGLKAQDTAELFFEDVEVPVENLLGAEGAGFKLLMHHLPLERLSIAANGLASAAAAFAWTLDYVDQRVAFGKRIMDFQNTRFVLADISTELAVTQAFVDKAIGAWNADRLDGVEAAKAKLWATDVQVKIIDRCLQLHGGYGYMTEYPIARAFQDSRVQKIYGGTTEIMKEIIGRDLAGGRR